MLLNASNEGVPPSFPCSSPGSSKPGQRGLMELMDCRMHDGADGTVMRSNTHRAERLADLIRQELGELIEYEIKDPRVGLVAVTAVEVAENLRRVRVLVRVPGDASEQQTSLQRLAAAQSFLRYQLAQRLGLRHTPEISLHLDKTPGGE